MNAPRCLAVLVVLLSMTAAADAQFVRDYFGGGFSYSRVRGRGSLSIGASFVRGGYLYPPFYPGFEPYGYRSTRITIVTVAPQPLYVLPPSSFLDQPPPDLMQRDRQLDEQLPVPEVPPLPRVPVPQVPKDEPKPKDEKKDEQKKEEQKKDEEKPKKE